MIRLLIPAIGLVLFFLEPVFGLFSPLHLGDDYYYVVPRFLLMYLIFVSIYYSRKQAVLYGLFFGLLYDVFFIDIIGLYSFLYPMLCLMAAEAVKSIQQNLLVTTALTIGLIALFEFVLYQFFVLISLTSMPLPVFLETRLVPTVMTNFVFLIMLGWVFRSAILPRLTERDKLPGLYL
ncbi:rod shape-determining protein MreD [Planococcus salinus]|uniref:Rod shape-determining protein MreD n=1 Tax=Planococcus salinus TaxID=1848460 RepID=A0A3M8PB73_9BACL|nr:rod shape-determining protein MreD [Planococcus salinus]RNF40945.1 rod shape-determining protein MreD [Planococcus salinus]